MFPIIPPKGNKKERQLLKAFKSLDDNNQESLIAFAEFLNSRSHHKDDEKLIDSTTESLVPSEPLEIPRPEEESVIKAIKRLSTNYPMIDKQNILNPISGVMTSHIMQGKSAKDAIDELEIMFLNEYKSMDKTAADA